MFAEIVTLELANGDIKRGQVLEVSGQKAVVQVPTPPPHSFSLVLG